MRSSIIAAVTTLTAPAAFAQTPDLSGTWEYVQEEDRPLRSNIGDDLVIVQGGANITLQLQNGRRIDSIIRCGGGEAACSVDKDWRKNVGCTARWEAEKFLMTCTWDAVNNRETDNYAFSVVDGALRVEFARGTNAVLLDRYRRVAAGGTVAAPSTSTSTSAAPTSVPSAAPAEAPTTAGADSPASTAEARLGEAVEETKEAAQGGLRRLRDAIRDRD